MMRLLRERWRTWDGGRPSRSSATTSVLRRRGLAVLFALLAGLSVTAVPAVASAAPAAPAAPPLAGDMNGPGGSGQLTTTVYRSNGTNAAPGPVGLAGVRVNVRSSSSQAAAIVGWCTTNASGTCTVTGLPTSSGGTSYWASIPSGGTPAGYSAIGEIWLGENDGSPGDPVTYQKTLSLSNGSPTKSTTLVVRRDNSAVPDRCGLKLALIIDTSGSTSGFQDGYKTAAKSFVSALAGTPSQIGVWTFAAGAGSVAQGGGGADAEPAIPLALTPVSNSTRINNAIDRIPAPGGGTNWDRGLLQTEPIAADIVIMITDGNPTVNVPFAPDNTSSDVDTSDVEAGILSANSVKLNGAKRIIAVGLGNLGEDQGSPVVPRNLIAISGPTANADYFTGSATGLGPILTQIAKNLCGGSVTVQKQLQSTPAGGFVNTAGWNYVPAISSGGGSVVANPASGDTAAPDGQVNFSFSGGTWPKTVTVTETLLSSQYALVQQSAKKRGVHRRRLAAHCHQRRRARRQLHAQPARHRQLRVQEREEGHHHRQEGDDRCHRHLHLHRHGRHRRERQHHHDHHQRRGVGPIALAGRARRHLRRRRDSQRPVGTPSRRATTVQPSPPSTWPSARS